MKNDELLEHDSASTHDVSLVLDDGSELSVQYTDALLEQVRERYGIPADVTVSIENIKLFLGEEINSALQKVK